MAVSQNPDLSCVGVSKIPDHTHIRLTIVVKVTLLLTLSLLAIIEIIFPPCTVPFKTLLTKVSSLQQLFTCCHVPEVDCYSASRPRINCYDVGA